MKDRVSLYPGRVKLVPVSGQENTYDMVRADEPTQEGTPLNKSSLLTDATAALFGLGSGAVPNDVLNVLSRFQSGMGNEHIWKRSDGAYVNSPNANAYPPAVSDGYTYEYIGQLGGAPRIATGSYVGTNTYGVNAPNSLTFEVVPKILFIIQHGVGYKNTDDCVGVCFPETMTNGYKSNFIQMFQSGSFHYLGVRESTALAKIDGKTVSWYAGSAEMQLNRAGIVYDYIAIS